MDNSELTDSEPTNSEPTVGSGPRTEITDAFFERFTDMDSSEQRRRLKKMSPSALQEMRIHLQTRIDDIEAQLQKAKQRAARDGEYADQEWFNSAQYAKKAMGRTIQYIQMLQSRASNGHGKVSEDRDFGQVLEVIESLSWRQFFVEEAKSRLSESAYMSIAQAAGERAQEALPEGVRGE